MSQLNRLVQHRDAILLAEAIGWLHDYRKCSEEQLQAQSVNINAQGIARNELTNRFNNLTASSLVLSTVTEQLPDLLNHWHGQATNLQATFLRQYLSRCHNTAHFDKQEPLDSNKQNYPGTQISTPFGFETSVGSNLTGQLWTLPWNSLTTYNNSHRDVLFKSIQSLFSTVGADTRRPINEISLSDWGTLVGALYKTALATVVLGQHPANHDLRWRLLSIRTDSLTYLTNITRLPDLEARKNTLQTAMNNVQALLEETYPLAAEVYRDENGSLYIVSDLPHLLSLQDDKGQTLLSYIQAQFATTDGEIVPHIMLDSRSWWGQDPNRTRNDEIPPAGEILSFPVMLRSDISVIHEGWRETRQTVCRVCGLRPCVSSQLDYCQICKDRRKGRIFEWLNDQSRTIWLDEVADSNGRLALLTGIFDLTDWLNGSLVETLLLQESSVTNPAITKTASFARLRRIWQSTKTFWQETQPRISETLSDTRRRLKITLMNATGLIGNQTYKLDLRGRTDLSVLWDGSHLISIDNLSYVAFQLGIKSENRRTPADAALAVGVWLEENQNHTFQLIADDEKNKRFDIRITNIDYQDVYYATSIPILAEPRTFMTLVPADKALDIAQTIQTKYEREMGKVRNRLPLHLGVIYFQRRTPLRAVLDAGKRMLGYRTVGLKDEVWRVVQDAQTGKLPDEKKQLAEDTQQFTETITIELEQSGRTLTWYVPARMGDGQTNDNWYPYVFIKGDVSGRSRIFKVLRPKGDDKTEECWLIHASELQENDQIYFTPATFDFQWLDSTARRFEIAYDKDTGQRLNNWARPYLIDDLDTFKAIWKLIAGTNGLTSSQMYALRDLVETKRESWQPTIDQCQRSGMFWQFCFDAVVSAEWKNKPTDNQFEHLTNWIVSGLFSDVIHLYMSIMKEKLRWEEEINE
ncbi:MAG: CRISPR-associated protein Csx11 [Chloroflexi bacterium AL-W]|nr:CRISPR-associated protein Csx11 [Chloroflexi bacterium AL-N1]NOK68524.1 CRISPR-associated protein Csx11 [Chloroflexi bacterium AL-N10]NOK74170.1 CRISPR-associated protein Csx11 [Chloroflexi bacterium AL-N5]NOK83137.1 CRISPR-associated protein Csx11 [Chloroflexi bacterium AL-W]NOK90660.1 CRISPR-associated protein Csx11 [Chloroflexi bacterium AL-N15]